MRASWSEEGYTNGGGGRKNRGEKPMGGRKACYCQSTERIYLRTQQGGEEKAPTRKREGRHTDSPPKGRGKVRY